MQSSLLALSDKPNSADGRHSFDSVSTGTLIPFINRNVSEYPTESGSPKFELVPVQSKKDIMINTARLYAEQEYNRIMDLVRVLENQAQAIKRRLEITDMIYNSEYKFEVRTGGEYWLVYDKGAEINRLSHMGPNDWATGIPQHYEYITKVKHLGDHTWCEIDSDGKPL